MILRAALGSILLASALMTATAFSSEGDRSRPELQEQALSAIDPDTAYVRTQSVFEHFGISPETFDEPIAPAFVTPDALAQRLRVFDPEGIFSRFSNSEEVLKGAGALRVFQDPRTLRRLDFEMPLSPNATEPFHERLLATRGNSADRPLAGLRIALDPGHMGGARWDQETGKFVHASDGRILSEGVMVLQISLLLEKQLQDLGAEVILTHRGLRPVTDQIYEKMDLTACERQEFRSEWLSPWFQDLLGMGDAGSGPLFSAFDESSDARKIFSDRMRWECFVEREDLDARVRVIQAFSPDLVLIIHLDSDDPTNDPNGINPKSPRATKAYVPGYHAYDELATREQRRHYAVHLLAPQSWDASVALSRSVVNAISNELGVERENRPAGEAVVIEPGVQGRNLRVLRRVTGAATSYIEGLYYNNPDEFEALYSRDHSMQIDGSLYPYSERLVSLTGAIRDGVLDFVRNYGAAR